MMVVWVHAVYVIPDVVHELGPPSFAGHGVDLFFVISGFVMGISTHREVGPAAFLCLRIVRVAPLYWLVTALLVACAAAGHLCLQLGAGPAQIGLDGRLGSDCEPGAYYSAGAIVKSLLFVPYRAQESPGSIWPILLQGWSLNYEMFFYTLCAISLALPRYWRIPALVAVLVGLAACGRLFDTSSSPVAFTYTNVLLLEFAAGAMLAFAWLRGRPASRWIGSALLLILGLYGLTSQHLLIVMLGAIIVVAGSLHPKICFINCRPLLALGNASYSVFLTHQLVLAAVAWVWMQAFPRVTWSNAVLFLLMSLAVTAVAGWLCYVLLERPLTRSLREAVKRVFAADNPLRTVDGSRHVA